MTIVTFKPSIVHKVNLYQGNYYIKKFRLELAIAADTNELAELISKHCLNTGDRVILNHLAIYLGVNKRPKQIKLFDKLKDTEWANGRRHLEKKIRSAKHGDIILIEEWREVKLHIKTQYRWIPIIEYNIVDPVILARDADFILNQNTLNKIES